MSNRPQTNIRLEEFSDIFRRMAAGQGFFAPSGSLQPNCTNCLNFQETMQLCSLNALQPPPKIAAHGCEMWQNGMDDVPF